MKEKSPALGHHGKWAPRRDMHLSIQHEKKHRQQKRAAGYADRDGEQIQQPSPDFTDGEDSRVMRRCEAERSLRAPASIAPAPDRVEQTYARARAGTRA